MTFNQIQFAKVVETAKTKAASSPRWIRAIDRAAAALMSGELIVTTLADGALVTSANGSYHANGSCQCKAAAAGHAECYHRAAARLVELYEETSEPETKPAPRSPRVTRSVERDVVTRRRVRVTRCDGWAI